MKITTSRIKEIIREELSRKNEGTPYEEANTVTIPGVSPQGLSRSLDKGGGLHLADDEVAAAFREALGDFMGVYEMGAGAGFHALVEYEDGRLVKVILPGALATDSAGDPDEPSHASREARYYRKKYGDRYQENKKK